MLTSKCVLRCLRLFILTEDKGASLGSGRGKQQMCAEVVETKSLVFHGIATNFLAGRLPKPAISAEPGSVVAKGSQVTILCEGTSGAQGYYLYQHRNLGTWHKMTLMKPGNMAKFLIPFTESSHAGHYLCLYHKPPSWSEESDTLELVVTGKGSSLIFPTQKRDLSVLKSVFLP